MKTVRPKPLSAPISQLPLSPEEGFVLSRIDGRLSVSDLVALTGIDEGRVEQIVTKLASHGAVALESSESSAHLPEAPPSSGGTQREETASLADFAEVLGMDPSTFAAPVPPALQPTTRESRSSYPAMATRRESEAELEAYQPPSAVQPVADENGEPTSDTQLTEANAEETAAQKQEDEDEEKVEANERNYRQLYESKFHALPTDARVHMAGVSGGADLLALCMDADPRVIAGIVANPTCGLAHARMIAFHHHNTAGLEMISRRTEFLRDALTERRLLRNPQSGEMVLGRIMSSKRIFQTYKIAIDREVPELTRSKSRGFLRTKFQTTPPEERADLVLRTEGRCLTLMTGCTFDGKTTAILCSRQYNSVLFIQNLAKFVATPPMLLAHLMKQPFVRKNVPLKRLLLQHPNMPGDVKRQF